MVHVPILYTPVFLMNAAIITRLVSGDWANGDQWGLKSFRENWWAANKAEWAVWIPVQFTTFALIPVHL